VSTNTSITLQFQILNSNYTTLLATAVDTSDNSSFTDSSTNALTLSPINAPTSSSFSPYRSGGYSTYFDGSGDYITAPSNTSFDFGTGDFTIETWINIPDVNSTWLAFISRGYAQNGGWRLYKNNGNNNLRFYYTDGGTTSYIQATTTGLTNNTWHHITVVRNSSTTKIYVDGVEKVSGTISTSLNPGSYAVEVGAGVVTSSFPITGYMTDVRIVKGTAVYTSTFTPPTKRLTAITNTSLLTCHLPYIADGSTNDHSITVNGNTSTKPFSPYDYEEYSAADHGGSIYFATSGSTATSGGSGQYVQSALASELTLDTNDFTIDCWVYGISKARNYPRVLQIGPQNTPWGSSQLSILYKHNDDNDSICLAMQGIGGNAMLIASGPIYDNVWYHVAVTRSGSTFTMYINGESVGIYTSTGSATGTGDKAILIGSSSAGDSDFNGYISDLRVFNGTVVYTGNFTPPTEPVSSSAAAVHVIGTDASIIDKSQNANLKLVGNTTGSTTQVKFADSKSMYFDGNGDYVVVNHEALGTGNWTIEGWVYFISTSTSYVFDFRASTNTNPALAIQDGDWRYITDTNYRIYSGVNPSTNTWYHFAIVKNNGTTTLYVNGSSIGTYADSLNYVGNSAGSIGKYHNSNSNFLYGYLQDFRISKGLARYTANFTPPTESLKG